jgi:RimJ/RimL family protein N-acetyltransferase
MAGDRAEFVVEDAATGAFAGSIGLHYLNRRLGEAMIGYSLRPEFRGKGIATRSVNLLCDWAFDSVGVARVIAGTFPENRASQRVLERAGFSREGYHKAELPGRDGQRIDNIQFVRLNPNLGA